MSERKHHLRKVHNRSNKTIDLAILSVIMVVAIALRLWRLDNVPLALIGTCSVYLIYDIGRQWFNRKVGLFTSAFFAVSQFAVNHAALPHTTGLFFVLLTAWFWSKIAFSTKKTNAGIYVGMALSILACSATQFFALAQALLVFLTGLFFLPEERRKSYCISGIPSLIVSVPTLLYVSPMLFPVGGNSTSLSVPTATFLTDFIQFTMNDSSLFMFSVGIIILLPLILGKRNKSRNPLRWVGIAWFVIIFGAALAYSLLREPILQYNILIFNYPFLIMAAFSLFKNRTLSPWQNALVVAVILFVGTSSLIFNPNKLIETSEKTATIQQTNFPTSKNCLFLRPNSIDL